MVHFSNFKITRKLVFQYWKFHNFTNNGIFVDTLFSKWRQFNSCLFFINCHQTSSRPVYFTFFILFPVFLIQKYYIGYFKHCVDWITNIFNLFCKQSVINGCIIFKIVSKWKMSTSRFPGPRTRISVIFHGKCVII